MTTKTFIKRVVRRLARVPYIGPIFGRLVQVWKLPSTVSALERLHTRMDALATRTDALATGYGAALRGTELSVMRLEKSLQGIYLDNDNLRSRLEYVRRELMFELRRQLHLTAPGTSNAAKLTPKIVSREKIDRSEPKRVNLGCGHVLLRDYINIDSRELPGVDVVAQVDALPFDAGSVSEIFSSHLIEHFTERTLRDTVLPHWNSLLAPGGELRFVTPDGEAMVKAYSDGLFSFGQLREVVFGGQEYEGDFHFTLLTPKSAEALLRDCGFTDVEVLAAGRRNGDCLEFELRARKAPGHPARSS